MFDVTIEKLINGGYGLAHRDGATVFTPYVLPGEVVSIEPTERKKKFVLGRLERVLTRSPERIAAACPHFEACGGCHYQHMGYEAQLKYKEGILRETLQRIGRIEWSGPITVHASTPWNCRQRAQWKIRGGEDGSRAEIGYFRAASSVLVPVTECPILSPRLLETLAALRAGLASGALPATLREAEAFADAQDDRVLLTLSFAKFPASPTAVDGVLRERMPYLLSILLQDATQHRMELFGPGSLRYQVGSRSFRVSHPSFFQTNRFLVEALAKAVVEEAGEGDLALDLFSGVGLFSLALAERFKRVVAVEANPAAARDLESNAIAAAGPGIGRIEPRESDAAAFLRRFRDKPDTLVLDPPRAGLEPEAAKTIAQLSASRIIYVSCEPSTLARDLALFLGAGYGLGNIHLFDLFPQTFHIETMVQLLRN